MTKELLSKEPSTASKILELAEQVCENAKELDESFHQKMSGLYLEYPCADDLRKDDEEIPSYFSELRSKLIKIEAHLNSLRNLKNHIEV